MGLTPTPTIKHYVFVMYMITNLDLIIDITATLNYLLSLLIKVLALLFITLLLSKASQASLLGLNYFCTILSSLINL